MVNAVLSEQASSRASFRDRHDKHRICDLRSSWRIQSSVSVNVNKTRLRQVYLSCSWLLGKYVEPVRSIQNNNQHPPSSRNLDLIMHSSLNSFDCPPREYAVPHSRLASIGSHGTSCWVERLDSSR